MDQEKYISLLHKQQQGTIDTIEQSILDHWLQQAEINRVLSQKIKEDWELTEAYEPPVSFDLEEEFTALQQRIQADEVITPKHTIAKVVPMNRSRSWLSWAAAIALLIGAGIWFLSKPSNDVPQLIVNTNTSEKKKIVLPDGTKVWLNEKSKLTYRLAFDKELRMVHLEGEAFFDVYKNTEQPFVIAAKGSFIRVLGTSFNVRALSNSQVTEVVVKTGKVSLYSQKSVGKICGDCPPRVVLLPNEKGIHDYENNLIRKTQSTELNELAWHNKVLLFKGTPIPEVLDNVKRLFDITIIADTASLDKCQVTGRFSNPTVDALLKSICKDFDITLKQVSDSEYELIGGNCE